MFPRDAHEPRPFTWVRNPRVRRTLILGSLWVALLAVLFHYRATLLPFGLALLLAFILEPAVERLTGVEVFGRPLGRGVALLACLFALVTLGAGFATWALGRVIREVGKLSLVTSQVVTEVRAFAGRLLDGAERIFSEMQIPIDRAGLEAMVEKNLVLAVEELSQNTASLLGFGTGVVGTTFQVVFGGFLVLMLTAFLSIDRFRIERFVESIVPPEARPAYRVLRDGTSAGLAGVVRGQVAICLTNGVLTFVGLALLSVKLPFILAGIAALFSLIPIFGSIISTLPIVAMALVDGPWKAVMALAWIVGIHLLEANLLNPKIMGDATKIHPVIVVFALIAGERTQGLIGALFAVPVAAVLVTLFKFLHARSAVVDDAEPALRPATVEGPARPPPGRAEEDGPS